MNLKHCPHNRQQDSKLNTENGGCRVLDASSGQVWGRVDTKLDLWWTVSECTLEKILWSGEDQENLSWNQAQWLVVESPGTYLLSGAMLINWCELCCQSNHFLQVQQLYPSYYHQIRLTWTSSMAENKCGQFILPWEIFPGPNNVSPWTTQQF